MADEYWQGQNVTVTALLTDPTQHVAPLAPNGETLVDDPGETFIAVREDGSHQTVSVTHPSVGTYLVSFAADVKGWWQVNDGRGGLYEFYVKPVRS